MVVSLKDLCPLASKHLKKDILTRRDEVLPQKKNASSMYLLNLKMFCRAHFEMTLVK